MRLIDANAFCEWLKEYGQEYIRGEKKISLMYIWKHVQDMPTIEPERKKGKWIRLTNDLAQCSECEDYIDNAISCGYNYCPNCGAEMEVEE